MKMSDVFNLPITQNKSHHFNHVVYSKISDEAVFSCHSNVIAEYACYAINNHDRLTEESAKLRQMLNCAVKIANDPHATAVQVQIFTIESEQLLKDQNNDK